MDLLDNIASELGFEFHLYIVHDELFGTKHQNLRDRFEPDGSYRGDSDVGGFVHKYNLNFNNNKNVNKVNNTKKSKFLSNSTRNPYDGKDNWKSHQQQYEQQQHQQKQQQYHQNHKYKDSSKSMSDHWNGIVGDLVTGSADLSFAALSVTK